MRQIVLDTETTGLEPKQGHRIIEIGCVEVENRRLTGRHYHQYICPQRDSDEGALAVHGITTEFLSDKPVFSQISKEFVEFIKGAQLIIHNAPFDLGFINHEFKMLKPAIPPVADYCDVIDTLVMARQKHPGQKNNLDALCKRYGVDNSQRDLHGALLDAEILADVYLLMTGGQTNLLLSEESREEANDSANNTSGSIKRLSRENFSTPVVFASEDELQRHEAKLLVLDKSAGGTCVWRENN
jgi:DNA polymerase-3 subunit epsilon